MTNFYALCIITHLNVLCIITSEDPRTPQDGGFEVSNKRQRESRYTEGQHPLRDCGHQVDIA